MDNELIENYGIIGDLHTVALVSRMGSIDWLCLPRFDSGACFASLVGTKENGAWTLQPADDVLDNHHNYIPGTLVLETYFKTATGEVKVTDFMPPRDIHPKIIRLVEGINGTVKMKSSLVLRFDYGSSVPWVRRQRDDLLMVVGPNSVLFSASVEMHGVELATESDFTISAGEVESFSMVYFDSIASTPIAPNPTASLKKTLAYWKEFISSFGEDFGEYADVVTRSLITLKALTYDPTGGIVAAPTTSLPEAIGGVRNWDYRYCWLRDATFTLYAMMTDGLEKEAQSWRDWLLRAAAGDPTQLQIMYGVGGERMIPEFSIPWLRGFADSAPVRVGNAASNQFQLDVYGELMDAFYQFRRVGLEPSDDSWQLELAIIDFVAAHWMEPDEGIWEIRGPRRHFTYSKVMAWVVFDRAVKLVERFGMEGPVEKWKAVREEIRASVMEHGYSEALGHFVQDYDSTSVDAALLLLALVGFIDAKDPKMTRTVKAIDEKLAVAGIVKRYETGLNNRDGLPGNEGVFLACSFWLVDNLVLSGRSAEAKQRFDHLLTLGNELGLFSEEYDPVTQRMLGNFPQALTHVGLINTARNLSSSRSPAKHRVSS